MGRITYTMDVREVRMVRFCCGSRLAGSNAIKAYCKSQPQLVCVPPAPVFRLQLGVPGHQLRCRSIRPQI